MTKIYVNFQYSSDIILFFLRLVDVNIKWTHEQLL